MLFCHARRVRPLAWMCLVWPALSPGLVQAAAPYVFHHEHVLGTSLELKVAAPSEAVALRAEALVRGEIERLAGVLSQYEAASEFSRWSRGELAGDSASPELWDVLRACDQWRERSGGAFNPAVAVYARQWQTAQAQAREPAADDLLRVAPQVAAAAWRWDEGKRFATRIGAGPLTIDALAKGYIIDRCCDVVLQKLPEVAGMLLEIGGDLRICGTMHEWVELANPQQPAENAAPLSRVRLNSTALATSGGYRRGWQIGQRHFSHILDPRTGWPAEHIASASVTAPRAVDADALATILCVLSPQAGLRLVAEMPRVECLLVGSDGRIYHSAGWREPLQLAQAEAPTPAAGGLNGHELLVRFEISAPDGARYHRPYVAAWVEDQQGFPLRTLILWVKTTGSGPTWVPDLKRWYRGDFKRLEVDRRDFVATRSSPTRPPGKYEIVWDGLDNLGKPAPPGLYNVRIEAAREHGTYQMIRKEVELAATPFKIDLPGGVEIKAASLEYRRRTAAPAASQ